MFAMQGTNSILSFVMYLSNAKDKIFKRELKLEEAGLLRNF